MDMLEHQLMVDNIEHLIINRHFEKEIKESVDYVYMYKYKF